MQGICQFAKCEEPQAVQALQRVSSSSKAKLATERLRKQLDDADEVFEEAATA